MGLFRFSLQPALNAAASREGEAYRALAGTRTLVDEARAALGVLDIREREFCDQARRLRSIAMPASQWIATEFFKASLRDVRSRRERAFECATGEHDAARVRLESARNGRLALDTLRERRKAEHRALQDLREAAEFDESNALRSRPMDGI